MRALVVVVCLGLVAASCAPAPATSTPRPALEAPRVIARDLVDHLVIDASEDLVLVNRSGQDFDEVDLIEPAGHGHGAHRVLSVSVDDEPANTYVGSDGLEARDTSTVAGRLLGRPVTWGGAEGALHADQPIPWPIGDGRSRYVHIVLSPRDPRDLDALRKVAESLRRAPH